MRHERASVAKSANPFILDPHTIFVFLNTQETNSRWGAFPQEQCRSTGCRVCRVNVHTPHTSKQKTHAVGKSQKGVAADFKKLALLTLAAPRGQACLMPPSPKRPAPKRTKKQPKLALNTSDDQQAIEFGEQPSQQEEEDVENAVENEASPDEDAGFDPLAEFRRASSAAAKAVKEEKLKHTEIERHLLCVFDEMEEASTAAGPGRVALADVLEAVARGTQPLTLRANTQRRPSKAVRLQLPPVFNRDQFLFEMDRVRKLMDETTFEANVLGLFACFYQPVVEHTQRAMAESACEQRLSARQQLVEEE